MYFDMNTKVFYIDVADDIYDNQGNIVKDDITRRYALNSYGAFKAHADDKDRSIIDTYATKQELSEIDVTMHTLTFGDGTFVYDGSEDVTVPVYTGEYDQF